MIWIEILGSKPFTPKGFEFGTTSSLLNQSIRDREGMGGLNVIFIKSIFSDCCIVITACGICPWWGQSEVHCFNNLFHFWRNIVGGYKNLEWLVYCVQSKQNQFLLWKTPAYIQLKYLFAILLIGFGKNIILRCQLIRILTFHFFVV